MPVLGHRSAKKAAIEVQSYGPEVEEDEQVRDRAADPSGGCCHSVAASWRRVMAARTAPGQRAGADGRKAIGAARLGA